MKIKLPVYFCLLIFIVPSSSCKKRLFDYRNKYLGNWDFTSAIHYCTKDILNGAILACYDTVIKYTGEVRYITGASKSDEIDLHYISRSYSRYWGDGKLGARVDKKGNLRHANPESGSSASGKFENKKTVSFIRTYDGWGGAYTATVNGTRK
jgi:hypothetical protein